MAAARHLSRGRFFVYLATMMKWFKRNGHTSPYEYERHKIGGHHWKVYKNPLDMPTMRRMAYYDAMYNVSLRIRGDDLDIAVDMMREKLNAGDFTGASWLLETMAAYRSLYTQRAVLFEVGNPIILLDDEPDDDMLAKYVRDKRELVETNDDVASFFLVTAVDSIMKTNSQSNNTNIEDYLRDATIQAIETRFLKSIGRNIWGNSPKSKTGK